MDVRTYSGFDEKMEAAAEKMDKSNIAEIGFGYELVKDGTPEAGKVKQSSRFYFSKEIKGVKYLVCLKKK